MKRYTFLLVLLAVQGLFTMQSKAQIITYIPGDSGGGYIGAPISYFDFPAGITIDRTGNIYISQVDNSNLVKKDVYGNIVYIIGNLYAYGPGFSGDGGPATAAQAANPLGLATDRYGNLYIADYGNNRIRKVDTAGIITTVAGNGLSSYGGDGGPATLASLNGPVAVAVDMTGNIYIADAGNRRIRKVDSTGIITTIAGNGVAMYSGDGGFATAAGIYSLGNGIAVDTAGNVYFIDLRIRKISASGIITAVAGNGLAGFSGDGGAALAAEINPGYGVGFGSPPSGGLACDNFGNLYISDGNNGRIRKVDTGGAITTVAGGGCCYYVIAGEPATSAPVFYSGNIACDANGSIYFIDPYTFYAYKVIFNAHNIPQFNRGNSQFISLCENATTITIDSLLVVYDLSGLTETWSVASPSVHGLVIGSYMATSTDSLITPFGINYTPDSGYSGLDSFEIRVSNGDTFAISKFLVNIRPIITAGSITGDSILCAGGVTSITLFDTINTIGGNWSSSGDLYISGMNDSAIVYGTYTGATIITFTNGCGGYATKSIITHPEAPPITVSTNVCTGDTITAYDVDSGGSWSATNDKLSISSTGTIIGISNGIDTIIYTLPTGCNSSTAIIGVGVPATIFSDSIICYNPYYIYSDSLVVIGIGGYWTSSNPDFSITDLSGGIGQLLLYTYGIDTITYTNSCGSVTRVVTVNPPLPLISVSSYLCMGDTLLATDSVPGGSWSSFYGYLDVDNHGYVTGVTAGGYGQVVYSLSGSCLTIAYTYVSAAPGPLSGDSIICNGSNIYLSDGIYGTWSSSDSAVVNIGSRIFAESVGTAIITYSNSCGSVTKSVTVNPAPQPISIAPYICMGDTLYASDSISGGTWSVAFNHVSVTSTGLVTAISAPTDYIYYTLPGGCYASAFLIINSVPPIPITGDSTVCVGAYLSLSDSTRGGGVWGSSNNSIATLGFYAFYYLGGFYGISAGIDTISYNNGCGSATKIITVNSVPNPIIGDSIICAGSTITLTESVLPGYWRYTDTTVAGIIAPPGDSTLFVSGLYAGFDTITFTNECGFTQKYLTINATPTSGSPIDSENICLGATLYLTPPVPGGNWSTSNSHITLLGPSPYGTNVHGYTIGKDTIAYTDSTICGLSVKKYIYKIYTIGAIIGPDSICSGSIVTFSDTTPGGLWYYTGLDSITETGVLTAHTPGIENIVYYVHNSCGDVHSEISIYIDTMPGINAISGNDSICAGSIITLSETATSGNWSASNANATIDSTGIVIAIGPGTDSILYSVSNSCGTATALLVLTINPLPVAGTIVGADSICTGDSTNLAVTSTGGNWRSHSGIASVTDMGLVRGISPGTDTIVYKVTNSCGVDSTIKQLIIKPLPNVAIITGSDSVCNAHTISLADSISGGNWYVMNSNASISSSGILTGSVSGTDTAIYVVTNFCGADTAWKKVIIKSLPFAGNITGADSVCPGRFIILSDSITGGIWATTNFNARVRKDSVFGITPGIDTIEYAIVNSCGRDIATYSVIISPEPYAEPITGSDSVCVGQQITLADATPGGVWSVADTNVSLLANIATGLVPGTDILFYTVTNSCGYYSATLNVRIISPISVSLTGNNYVCIGKTDTLIGSPAGGNWSVADTNASVLSGIVTGSMIGKDTIFYMVPNFCGLSKDSIAITIYTPHQCDSINEVRPVARERNITLYPNPAGNWIAIEGGNGCIVSVINLFGQVVQSFVDAKDIETVNIEGLVNGIYVVTVVSKDGVSVTKKIVKI